MSKRSVTLKETTAGSNKILTVLGMLICMILIPILIINATLIIRSYTNPEKVPDIGGVLPLIVLTDSMYPEIQSGDLIICHTREPEEIKEGDVIAFFDPAGNGTSVVTHRVIEIVTEDGILSFRTQGDANNAADDVLVPAENLVGIYQTRIAGAGNIAIFMQTTQGMIICVFIPIILLICYDVIRHRIYERGKKDDTDALLAELEILRAEIKESGRKTKQ
jgi:signal peptidase